MRDLEAYIEELLYENECVIVPGFGGFITNLQPAAIKENMLVPRGRTLLFNRQLKNNDGLLAGHIAKTEGDYSLAMRMIGHFVRNSNETLEQGKTLELKRIGNLSLGPDNNVLFQPSAGHNFELHSYGLLAIQAGPVLAKETASKGKDKKKVRENKPAVKTLTLNKSSAWKSYLVAASFFGALAVSGVLLWDQGVIQQQIFYGSLNPFPSDTFTGTVKPVTEEVKKEEASEIVPAPATEDTLITETPAEVPVLTEVTVQDDSLYYVILGAFSREYNANKLKAELTAKGYQPETVYMPGSALLRVSGMTLSARPEAEKQLEELKARENPDAWLLVQKKQN